MNVLVVDDSRAMRMIVIRTLRQAGFDGLDISEATNGREAFDAIQADRPDLVLSDWNMPEMTGIELLQALRRAGIDVPFGFVTSEGSDEMRGLASQSGALFLIAKPFNADSMRDCLSPVLGAGSRS
ncbi:MAG: response regulator receiver protein [Frankiales bacterium]|jgi:two-component system chemotaxis response regulator CheY|nr:response regulator receiver protein [Frankiales bacterium]